MALALAAIVLISLSGPEEATVEAAEQPVPALVGASAPEPVSTPDMGTSAAASVSDRGWRSIVGMPGVTDALLSGVGFGMFFVCISRASADAGYWPLLVARSISVVIFADVAIRSSVAVFPPRGSRMPVVLAGVLDGLAAIFFVLSTRSGLLSVGAVLASLYPGATVVLAWLIIKERITVRQVAGLVLAVLAVSMLAV